MKNIGVTERDIILNAINKYGIDDIFTAILRMAKVIEVNSVGQLLIHINNGGVTKICKNNWEIK
jgi:hypothetical protein